MAIFQLKCDYRYPKGSLESFLTNVRVCVHSGERVKGRKNELNGHIYKKYVSFAQFLNNLDKSPYTSFSICRNPKYIIEV